MPVGTYTQTCSVHSPVGFYTSDIFAFLEMPAYVVIYQQPAQVEAFKSAAEGASVSAWIKQKIWFSKHGDFMEKKIRKQYQTRENIEQKIIVS